ncbi:metallophosphoesterase [Streptomyces sp. NBC_00341]|uniref:metallophosphoesterase n=2 Tax=unclassified Streptomyces TaxID=2593676 RepID=UPI0018FE7B3B|nr:MULTISPECIES: metallophosphoesterase [unclassified Streptomyces]WRZ16732.1 metallophosphoesterase [Streptomyces sp. NBC_00341]
MPVLLVAVMVVALLAGVHRYVWRRLVRDVTAASGPVRRAGTVAAFVLPVLSVGALIAGQAGAPFWLQQTLAWPGFVWLALLLYVVLALVAGEVLRPLLSRALDRRATSRTTPAPVAEAAPPTDPAGSGAGPDGEIRQDDGEQPSVLDPRVTRRLLVSRIVGGAAAAAATATVGAGMYNVMRGPAVKRITVPLTKLPRAAHGYRIAVVSDIHLGPIMGRAHTQRIVDAVNATQPDLVAVVGDLVDGSVADLGDAAEPLARLRARDGSYFVTGNHEYYSGVEEWVDRVRELGVHPLRNAHVEIAGFDLAGVNDISGEEHHDSPDYGRALGDRDPSRASVLLAHQPVMIHEAVKHGVDLQLSGHTHGGQLWPGNYIAELSNPTVAGLDRYGDTQLYVTRGAGAWGPPVRVGAPSDITIVELASRQA